MLLLILSCGFIARSIVYFRDSYPCSFTPLLRAPVLSFICLQLFAFATACESPFVILVRLNNFFPDLFLDGFEYFSQGASPSIFSILCLFNFRHALVVW